MQASESADDFGAGAEIKMVGVAEKNLDAEVLEHGLGLAFDCRLRADGHEDGSFDGSVRSEELRAAGFAGGRADVEFEGQRGIVAGLGIEV
jgi:hypothetical protein